MRAIDDAAMLADDHALRRDNDAIGIDPKAHGPIGKGCRDAVAIALQMNEAGRGDPLGVFDKAVEGRDAGIRARTFLGPDIGDGAAHLPCGVCAKNSLHRVFQPVVQGGQRWKARHGLPEPMTRILDVLLDLSLLPARCRIAELGFEEVVAGHGHEADVDVALLAASDLVDRGLHVVVDAAPGNAAEDPEGMIVGVEQHLVRLQEIGPHDEGPAVAQLVCATCSLVRSLPMIAQSSDQSNWKASPRFERQRHEGPAPCRLQLPLPIGLPLPGKGRHPIVGTAIAEAHQIGMQLLQRPLLLAGLVGLRLQPGRQSVGKRIKLARPLRHLELRLYAVTAQIFADGIPGQAGPAADLPDR
jgi:hypothetical protein